MKQKVCIIGKGYVGSTLFQLFNKKYETSYKEINDDYKNVNNCDVAIVCVPTEPTKNGECDISIVEEVISNSNAPIYLIKSSVPPKTTEMLKQKYGNRIVFSPEYIGEGGYPVPYWQGIPHPTDMSLHNFQIFGGDKKDTKIMVDLFTPVLGPYCKFFQTDSRSAEIVKYMENSFIGTKVVFCHEFARIIDQYERDYNEIREMFVADERVGRGFTSIFNNKLGYSGKCIPKDISAIYKAVKNEGFDSKFLKQLMSTNNELLKSNLKEN